MSRKLVFHVVFFMPYLYSTPFKALGAKNKHTKILLELRPHHVVHLSELLGKKTLHMTVWDQNVCVIDFLRKMFFIE